MAARDDILGVWGEENSPGIHWAILDCCHLLDICDNDDEQDYEVFKSLDQLA